MLKANKFQLQECVPVFWQEFVKEYPAWGAAKWIPSVDNCIRSRMRTSGIVEIEFEHDRVKYKVFDAGGQRSERRKWIHAFEDVSALIFVASLTDYDEVLYEDHSKNRLEESLEVFNETVNSKHFLATPVILFFNKMDLFIEKYVRRGVPLNVSGCFPDAPKYTPEFPIAIEWISKKYLSQRTKGSGEIKIHTTTGKVFVCVCVLKIVLELMFNKLAVDPNQVEKVFNDMKSVIILRHLASARIE